MKCALTTWISSKSKLRKGLHPLTPNRVLRANKAAFQAAYLLVKHDKKQKPSTNHMAIYHCTTKTISRSSGRSAVASGAYRAGEEITNEMTGLTHDFTRKEGVMYTEIISNLDAEIKRSDLWNLAEKSENRKDA